MENKVRRRTIRRLQAAALSVTVVVGTGAGVYGLARVFRTEPTTQLGAAVENRRIAFSSYEVEPPGMPDGFSGWRIYTMEPDGTDVRLIGPDGVDEALYPTWSPDASRIAFVGRVAELEEPGIYVIDADGSGLTEIFRIEGHRQVDGLEWSPDGSRLGFVYTEFNPAEPPPEAGARAFDRSSTIWTVAADGSDATAVTTLGRETALSWSPDGSRILFARSPLVTENRGDPRNGLWIVDADGTNERHITHSDDHSGPAWSPDGTTIVFDEAATGGTGLDLYAVDADGGMLRRLTADEGNEYGAVWSPDGSQIAYATREADPGYDESVCHIRVMNADGSDVRSLIAAPGSEGCPGQLGVSWAGPVEPAPTATESEMPESTSTPSEPPEAGRDIGLAFNLCDVTAVRGHFGTSETIGAAYVGSEVRDGVCPNLDGAAQVVAVDLDGDERADASLGPLTCDPWCTAWAAPDVDGDGSDEILVQNIQFSIAGLHLYDVVADPPGIVAVTVAPPGDPGVFEPGDQPQLWYGGDGFNADHLACSVIDQLGQVLTYASANQDPPEFGPWRVHATTFRLVRGTLEVVGVRDFEADEPPFEPVEGLCGAENPYWGG